MMAAASKFPYEDAKVEEAMQLALDDMFTLNKAPDLTNIPPGPCWAILTALNEALQESGEIGLQQSWKGLIKTYPWLKPLRSKPVPPRKGTEEVLPAIKYFRDADIENMPAYQWLIPGILPKEGVVILYGVPGTFKSFLAIDWALSVGFGYGWLGREIKQGGVVYIAGEGSGGLRSRVLAWKSYHGKSGNSEIRWITQAVNLNNIESILPLEKALGEIAQEIALNLIIIDTFSRNSGDSDENSNKDVKIFMRDLNRMREQYNCSILLIHHAGKDLSKGIRGASAFTGDSETNICLEHAGSGAIKMTIPKQKEKDSPQPIFLTVHPVMFGDNPEEDSSIVLVKSDAPVEEEKEDTVSSKKSVQTMYDVLIGKELTVTEWVALGIEQSKTEKNPKGMSKRTAMNAREELYETSKVWYKKDSKLYYVPEKKSTAKSGDESPKERKDFSITEDILNALKRLEEEKGQGATYEEWIQRYAAIWRFDVKDIKNNFSMTVDTLLMNNEVCCNDGLYSTAREEGDSEDE